MILPFRFSIYIIHHLTCRFAVAFYGGSTRPQLVALVAQVRRFFNNLVICFSDMSLAFYIVESQLEIKMILHLGCFLTNCRIVTILHE